MANFGKDIVPSLARPDNIWGLIVEEHCSKFHSWLEFYQVLNYFLCNCNYRVYDWYIIARLYEMSAKQTHISYTDNRNDE